MSTISGSDLKAQREALNIPLERIAKETRIRLSILQDLEDEEYSELSSSAQTKGFLRLYADYLSSHKQRLGIELKQDTNPASTEKKDYTDRTPPDEIQRKLTPVLTDDAHTISAEQKTPIDQNQLSIDQTNAESESQKMLLQIGRDIASRRKVLNLDWDIIIQQTHLKRTTLNALENGNLEAFTTPLEFRKNLQTYVRFLNLDVDSVMLQFAEALQKRRSEINPSRRKSKPRSKQISNYLLNLRKFFTLDLLFGTLLIIGILIFLIWGVSNMNQVKDKSLELTETLPGIIDFILSTPFTPEFQETPSPETEDIFYIPTATAFYIQEPPEDGIRVTLHARQNIWIRIYVDDELSYVGRLTGGEVKSFSANASITLETSNIAVLEIAFQGNQIEPIYRNFGSPARLFFDFDGMQELPITEPSPTSDSYSTPSPTGAPNDSP